MNIIQKPVINHSKGRSGHDVKAIVLHIAEGSMQGAYSWFNTPTSYASSHYMISKAGEIWQFVQNQDAAWHAGGVSNPSKLFTDNFDASVNPNLYTIGIEHEGFTGEKFPEPMLKALQDLVEHLARLYKWEKLEIGKNILSHADINQTSRSRCPGAGIDIQKDLINPVNERIEPTPVSQTDLLFNGSLILDGRNDVVNAYKNPSDWVREGAGLVEGVYRLGEFGRTDVLDHMFKNIAKGIPFAESFITWYGTYGQVEFRKHGLNFWTSTRKQNEAAVKNNLIFKEKKNVRRTKA